MFLYWYPCFLVCFQDYLIFSKNCLRDLDFNLTYSAYFYKLTWADGSLVSLASVIRRPSVRLPSSVVCSSSVIIFSAETTGLIKVKFHMELLWDRGTKVCSNSPGHITKMAAMPIYVKNIKNLLLLNQKTDGLETLYAALSARILPSLLNDLDLFYGKVKFGPLCFCMGKG